MLASFLLNIRATREPHGPGARAKAGHGEPGISGGIDNAREAGLGHRLARLAEDLDPVERAAGAGAPRWGFEGDRPVQPPRRPKRRLGLLAAPER